MDLPAVWAWVQLANATNPPMMMNFTIELLIDLIIVEGVPFSFTLRPAVFFHEKRKIFWLSDNKFHLPIMKPCGTQHSYYVRILASLVNLIFRYFFPVPNVKLTDAISSHVAAVLKEEREKRALSLKMLARKAGVSRQTISYVEQEVQSPSLDTLLRITSALDVDLAKIIARAQKRALKKAA
jgi:DNA-binding XRE family transcriptional regulator